MEKEEKGKNIMKMENYNLKVTIYMEKEIVEKNMIQMANLKIETF